MRTTGVSARAIALAGLVLLFCQMAFAQTMDQPPSHWPIRVQSWTALPRLTIRPVDRRNAPEFRPAQYADTRLPLYPLAPFRPAGQPEFQLSSFRSGLDFSPPRQPSLSLTAWRVSQIASRVGDRTFLMIDKMHGRIMLFQDGALTFEGPALTGASLADRLPPDALSKTYAQGQDLKYRVTPAGRYTVSPGYDRNYGPTLDINEIRGRDWRIAIHTVVSGARAGHREVRLRSPLDEDKHITEGCINVDSGTMWRLTRLLATRRSTPVYILPTDERLITAFF